MNTLHPNPKQLAELTPLIHFSDDELQRISNDVEIKTGRKGEKLLKIGDQHEDLLFLLEGTVILRAEDGGIRQLNAKDSSAKNPIARLRPSRFDVVASGNVSFIQLTNDILSRSAPSVQGIVLEEVEEDSELAHQLGAPNPLREKLQTDLDNNRLVLPSLPDVAIKVGLALKNENSNAKTMAKIIGADPAIASKLLKVANSGRYGGRAEIASLEQAIARIGLKATHKLVVLFALRDLFRCRNRDLNQRMHDLWLHCRKVAAISHVLALQHDHLDPDTALLGGLIHDIGTLAILGYVQRDASLYKDIDSLDTSIKYLRGPIGKLIINKWKLPHELAEMAELAEDWEHDHKADADYIDIVIIAQIFSFQELKGPNGLPNIETLPAYTKLGLSDDEEDSGLVVLIEADADIEETESLLGG